MREILFRGKTTENRWVEGTYFKHDTVNVCFSSDDPKPRHLIIQDGFCDWGFEPPIHCVDVAPDTVGQYTGLTDKNGKKIFEGDIVRDSYNSVGIVEFGTGTFDSGVYCYTGWHRRERDGCVDHTELHDYGWPKEFEVIGNIHDNPELLGGER